MQFPELREAASQLASCGPEQRFPCVEAEARRPGVWSQQAVLARGQVPWLLWHLPHRPGGLSFHSQHDGVHSGSRLQWPGTSSAPTAGPGPGPTPRLGPLHLQIPRIHPLPLQLETSSTHCHSPVKEWPQHASRCPAACGLQTPMGTRTSQPGPSALTPAPQAGGERCSIRLLGPRTLGRPLSSCRSWSQQPGPSRLWMRPSWTLVSVDCCDLASASGSFPPAPHLGAPPHRGTCLSVATVGLSHSPPGGGLHVPRPPWWAPGLPPPQTLRKPACEHSVQAAACHLPLPWAVA